MFETEDKFLEIYEKYKNLVLKVSFDMTGDFHLAQDICQETFLKLYGFQEYVDESRIKSWLVIVAINKIRDTARKGGKYKEILNFQEELGETADWENSIERYLDQLGQNEFRNRMLEELRKKNQDWYETFILAEYLDIPRKVIAKRRGIALSTVDAYLRKGKHWMKINFEKEYREL